MQLNWKHYKAKLISFLQSIHVKTLEVNHPQLSWILPNQTILHRKTIMKMQITTNNFLSLFFWASTFFSNKSTFRNKPGITCLARLQIGGSYQPKKLHPKFPFPCIIWTTPLKISYKILPLTMASKELKIQQNTKHFKISTNVNQTTKKSKQ